MKYYIIYYLLCNFMQSRHCKDPFLRQGAGSRSSGAVFSPPFQASVLARPAPLLQLFKGFPGRAGGRFFGVRPSPRWVLWAKGPFPFMPRIGPGGKAAWVLISASPFPV